MASGDTTALGGFGDLLGHRGATSRLNALGMMYDPLVKLARRIAARRRR